MSDTFDRVVCAHEICLWTEEETRVRRYLFFFFRPAELQFYTSLASIVVQIPVSVLLVDLPTLEHSLSFKLFAAFLLNGVFFHFQSITAYVLMDYISPVTHR